MNVVPLVDKIVSNYEKWVIQNSGTLGEMESVVKYLSYIFTSQMENANLLSELFHSLSKLMVFYNDQIIYKACIKSDRHDRPNPYSDSLKRWLTIIGHCEVLIELSAQKVWGTFGRWLIICVIQTFKTIIRLTLLFDRKEIIVEPNPISPLNRKNIEAIIEETPSFLKNDVIVLPNGRIIRSIDKAPSIENRIWKSLNNPLERNFQDKVRLCHISGEVIHIIKPLLHLGSLYCCGTKSWKPWMLSLVLDIASLRMLTDGNDRQLNPNQRAEITRRSLVILMYLMRSPFYDRKTKDYVNSALMRMSKLPLLGIFFKSLKEYLPQWQQTYFYLWSS